MDQGHEYEVDESENGKGNKARVSGMTINSGDLHMQSTFVDEIVIQYITKFAFIVLIYVY